MVFRSDLACAADRQPGIQEEVDGELTITDSCPRTAPRWAPIQDPSTVSKLQLDSSQVARERATPCLTTKGSRFPDPTSPSQQLEDTENVQQAEASGQEQPHQVKTVGSDHDFINRKISSPTVDLGLATQPETSLQGTEDATNPVPPLIQLLQLCNQEVTPRSPPRETARICRQRVASHLPCEETAVFTQRARANLLAPFSAFCESLQHVIVFHI